MTWFVSKRLPLYVGLIVGVCRSQDSTMLLQTERYQETSPDGLDVVGAMSSMVKEPASLASGSQKEKPSYNEDKDTSKVIDDMHENVGALITNLDKMEADNKESLSAQSSQYVQQLHNIEANISAITSVNAELQAEVDRLTSKNTEKQTRAKNMEESNKQLSDELAEVRDQLSQGQEYVKEVVNTLADTGFVPALEVLRELERQDTSNAIAVNVKGLRKVLSDGEAGESGSLASEVGVQGTIGDEQTAMLEGDTMTHASAGIVGPAEERAADKLQGLEATMEAYAKQREEMESKLKDQFVATFKERVLKRSSLQKQQEELRATVAEGVALGSRLDVAISYLEVAHKELQDRLDSVRASVASIATPL